MNKYQKSMEDIKLSEESKDRILKNISEHYAKASDEKTTRIRRINFATKWVAVAAAVLLIVIATPIGVKLVRDNSQKEAKGNMSQVTETPASSESSNGNGQSASGDDKKTSSIPDPKGENSEPASQIDICEEDRIRMLNEGKYTSAEVTACRYDLEGKTPERFIKEILAISDEDWSCSVSNFAEAGPASDTGKGTKNGIQDITFVRKNGRITNAYVVNGDEILVCSFLTVVNEEAAVAAVRNILGFKPELK